MNYRSKGTYIMTTTTNTYVNTVIMQVDQDIHCAYKMLSKLELTNEEIEFYLVKFVNNIKKEAKNSLDNIMSNNALINRNVTHTDVLKEYYNAIINRCDQVLNDSNYIRSIVY